MRLQHSRIRTFTNNQNTFMKPGMSGSALEFEFLVRRIFEANGYRVVNVHITNADSSFDFSASSGNETLAVEVKFYRTSRAQGSLLASAAARLATRGLIFGAWGGMLVVSCVVPEALRVTLEDRYSIVILDRPKLLSWAAKDPGLVDALHSLIDDDLGASPEPARPDEKAKLNVRKLDKVDPDTEEDTRGTDLCQELHALKRGKTTWASPPWLKPVAI